MVQQLGICCLMGLATYALVSINPIGIGEVAEPKHMVVNVFFIVENKR